MDEERGFALVLALAVTFVFSMTVVTVIESATSNSRSSDRSKGRVSAYSLAEAGINNAASILSKSNSYDPHVLHPQGTYALADCASPPANPTGATLLGNTCSPYSWTYDGGTTTMWGWFDTATSNWTITLHRLGAQRLRRRQQRPGRCRPPCTYGRLRPRTTT